MNIKRGMFRVWCLFSVLWIAAILGFLALEVHAQTTGPYQFELETRSNENPFDAFGKSNESFKTLFLQPSEMTTPFLFSAVDPQYVDGFDNAVNAGSMQLNKLPDGSKLYISSDFSEGDKSLLVKRFWHTRWHRRFQVAMSQPGFFFAAFGLPILLIIGWFIGHWVIAGFKPKSSGTIP